MLSHWCYSFSCLAVLSAGTQHDLIFDGDSLASSSHSLADGLSFIIDIQLKETGPHKARPIFMPADLSSAFRGKRQTSHLMPCVPLFSCRASPPVRRRDSRQVCRETRKLTTFWPFRSMTTGAVLCRHRLVVDCPVGNTLCKWGCRRVAQCWRYLQIQRGAPICSLSSFSVAPSVFACENEFCVHVLVQIKLPC